MLHTAEVEPHPLAARFPFLGKLRFMQSEDTMLATLASWSLGLVLFTLAGFYFGSIAGHDNHPKGVHHDLNPAQLGIEDPLRFQGAAPYMVGGLLFGIFFALCVTFLYVPNKLRELELEQGHH